MLKLNFCLLFVLLCFPCISFAQNNNAVDTAETGISVSPSTLRFNAKPGATQTRTIKINNDTRSTKKFQMNFNDFGELTDEGKTKDKVSPDYKYALSKWLSVSPTYVEIKSRESKVVTITLEVPNEDAAAIAAWTMITVDQVTDKKTLEIPNATASTMGFGVTQGFGFGIYVYQNPPNVANNKVDITSLKFDNTNEKHANQILMDVKNIGDGISFCNYYVEITSLNSGVSEKVSVKRFTILPGYKRSLIFDIPSHFQQGKYSAVAVLDFGSKDDLQTAELDFELK